MKTRIKKLIPILLGTSIVCTVFGLGSEMNPGNLTGRVTDSSDQTPMEYVTVVLYSLQDSSLITGTITDIDGNFSIQKADTGLYYMEVSFLGFEKKQIPSLHIAARNQKINLGEISLSPAQAELGEVTLVAERSRIEYQVDKRVVNVDKDLSAQGGTAINALENTPSVQVDTQGNLTLRGSSDYIVLVDGKPSILKGSDALKQLPASLIRQIEIITNPSAKYDADGNAGIINVVLKKEKMQGFSSASNISLGTNHKNELNTHLNYRQDKINYFTGVEYAYRKYYSDITFHNASFLDENTLYVDQEARQFTSNDRMMFRGGIDYDVNDKNAFSVSAAGGMQGYDNGTDATYNRRDELGLNSFNLSTNYMDVSGQVSSLTTDYKHSFSEKHILSFSANCGLWTGTDENNLKEYKTNENFKEEALASALKFTKDNYNYNLRANLDYTVPLKEAKLETGLQYRNESREEDLVFTHLEIPAGNWIEDELFSYRQDYMNAIYSGYAMYSNQFHGYNYQLGIRSEYFMRSIDIDKNSEPIDFNTFMFYPSIHLSKEFKEKHQFQLSFSRRVNRPQPWLLSNTPSYVDPYNIFYGSPDLKFEFSDNFEFNYRTIIDKITLSTQTYFRNTSNAFTTTRSLNEEGIMIHQLTNAAGQVAFGIEQNIDYKITDWWQLSGNANLYNYKLSVFIDANEQNQQVNTWDARFSSNYIIHKDTRLQVSGFYRGKGVDAMGETSDFIVVNLAINQSFLEGKLKIGLTAQNLFNSQVFDYTILNESVDNHYQLRSEGPVILANLNYNFNNYQQKRRGRNDDIQFKDAGAF